MASRKSWRDSVVSRDKAQSKVVEESSRLQRGTPLAKKMFSSQMDEKWRRGIYYHCNEKWNLAYVRIPRCTCYK